MNKWFLELTELDVDKKFRINQIEKFVFENGVIRFENMTSLPKNLVLELQNKFSILSIIEESRIESKDGTVKFLFKLDDENYIESVFLKDINDHVTFCISSQVGCRIGCKFCKTGEMGLIRNLRYDEIVSQVIYLNSFMISEKGLGDRKFNIVYMGMGEPLDNSENVIQSIDILVNKFKLAQSRITISTSGVLDKIDLVLSKFNNVKIALSLNSSIDSNRELIMPITKKFSVKDIYNKLVEINKKYGNRITLEYVLVKGFNDSDDDIKYLELFNLPIFHINIIPLNNSTDILKRPTETEIKNFIDKLTKKGFCVSRRFRRGGDIQADCGQLYYKKTFSND